MGDNSLRQTNYGLKIGRAYAPFNVQPFLETLARSASRVEWLVEDGQYGWMGTAGEAGVRDG